MKLTKLVLYTTLLAPAMCSIAQTKSLEESVNVRLIDLKDLTAAADVGEKMATQNVMLKSNIAQLNKIKIEQQAEINSLKKRIETAKKIRIFLLGIILLATIAIAFLAAKLKRIT